MTMKKLTLLLLLIASPIHATDLKDVTAKLASENVKERRAASEALGQMGVKAIDAKAALYRALTDSDVMVRANAAWALGKIDPRDRETIQKLIAATGDNDWSVRHNAAQSLVKAGPAAIESLEECLKNSDAWQRFYAADTLVRIDRQKSGLALPILVAALKSTDAEMQGRSIGTVSFLGRAAESAAPELLKLAGHPNNKLRISAITAAGAFGPAVKEGVPDLINLLEKEKDDPVRCAVYATLAAIGEPSELIIPALVKGLAEKKERPQAIAGEALAKLGVAAVEPLLKAIQSGNFRVAALDSLVLIGPAAKGAVPVLLDLMDDRDWMVRQRAAATLGVIGEANDRVRNTLVKASNDPHESVRAHATAALTGLENKLGR